MISASYKTFPTVTGGLVTFPNGWLSFELGVLRRLKFYSVALPFTGEPDLGVWLKQWKIRVATNDPMLWSFVKATALVENNSERLDENDLNMLLDDAYVPRDDLANPSLQKWFNETDAFWFENLRANTARLQSPYKQALALTAGMTTGDCILSFNGETRALREPLSLSRVFRLASEVLPAPCNNDLRNKSAHQEVRSFLAERHHTDLLFLRLPAAVVQSEPARTVVPGWREEWLRGNDAFWEELEVQRSGTLGSRIQSKQQYLGFVEDVLHTAAHIPTWAIAHTENGFITKDELVETVARIRKVTAIYSKDFSDLLGVKASIIIA